MPKIPQQPNPEICNFPKHKGRPWTEVVKNDASYMEWLISFEGPPMTEELYNTIVSVLEEYEPLENF